MTTSRELPRAEWDRLDETPLKDIWRGLPETAVVLVAEVDGVIVGHAVVLPVLHVEGLWIDPAHRREGGVWWALLDQQTETVRRLGESSAVVSVESDAMKNLARVMGAERIPGELYLMPLGRR